MGRIITGLILIIAWGLLLFAGPYLLFCSVIAIGGGIALYEFFNIGLPAAERKNFPFLIVLGIFPILVASLWGIWALASSLFGMLLLLIIFTLSVYRSLENGLIFLTRSWFGIFYIGFCTAHLVLLRAFPQGTYWLLLLTAITVCSDTGAYYTGRMFGKTKLYPALSPGKTREGALGGIVSGALGGSLVAALLLGDYNLLAVGALSVVLSIIGIIGDLVESLVKRVSGVKDSGHILPGHGGLLDRCDSLLLTAPAMYYVLIWSHEYLIR